jgi:hypothetical protein
MRFIEVVDVENQIPLGAGKAAKVHQMAVAANLLHQAGMGRMRQFMRLNDRAASVEGEWRGQHPSVTKRHQSRHASGTGCLQELDGVSPKLSNFMVRLSAHFLSQGTANGECLLQCVAMASRHFGLPDLGWRMSEEYQFAACGVAGFDKKGLEKRGGEQRFGVVRSTPY